MLSALKSIWTWAAIGVLMVWWVPLLALVRLFDDDLARRRTGRWLRRLGQSISRVNPSWKIEVFDEAREALRKPCVVVSNHLSNADIPVISCLPWDMKWVAKAELFRLPVAGWLLKLSGDIPVDRTSRMSRARALVAARGYLEMQCPVIFFPEGTRSRDGRVYAFNEGAFHLAVKAQVPVVPLAIDGTQDALPSRNWQFGQAEAIKLKALPPVPTTGLTPGDIGALRERVRSLIVAQLAAWRGVPPDAIDADAAEDKVSVNTPSAAAP